ncbi:MAG: hypothetical protein AB7U98_04040 [Candidatus Nitrosocosmicus sp.]|jgi:hypothetical protein|uniref:hypothetical protein n=1 Tax=Candidatus Nitrosocosmicus sp. FF01 TaxID=3397670 RepID=UPI002A6C3407|nr:hypothetical protein [Candidatus Nitrosocosmicus sp.]
MSVTQVSKEILSREPKIRFVGILKSDGQDISINPENNIDKNDINLSMTQTPHLLDAGKRFTDLGNLESVTFEYDKMKLINLPTNSEIVICGTDNDLSNNDIKKIVSDLVANYNFKADTKYETEQKSEFKNDLFTKDSLKEMAITSNQFENAWHSYVSSMIGFWKEMAITSIKMNEKIIKEFWNNYKDK